MKPVFAQELIRCWNPYAWQVETDVLNAVVVQPRVAQYSRALVAVRRLRLVGRHFQGEVAALCPHRGYPRLRQHNTRVWSWHASRQRELEIISWHVPALWSTRAYPKHRCTFSSGFGVRLRGSLLRSVLSGRGFLLTEAIFPVCMRPKTY